MKLVSYCKRYRSLAWSRTTNSDVWRDLPYGVGPAGERRPCLAQQPVAQGVDIARRASWWVDGRLDCEKDSWIGFVFVSSNSKWIGVLENEGWHCTLVEGHIYLIYVAYSMIPGTCHRKLQCYSHGGDHLTLRPVYPFSP